MKILELNTQNIIEENRAKKLEDFVKRIISEQPDTFSLKDVGQSATSPRLLRTDNLGYVPCQKEHVRIRLDNMALSMAEMLKREGFPYQWTWIPSKGNQGKFERGKAIFFRNYNEDTKQFIFCQQEEYIKETIYE